MVAQKAKLSWKGQTAEMLVKTLHYKLEYPGLGGFYSEVVNTKDGELYAMATTKGDVLIYSDWECPGGFTVRLKASEDVVNILRKAEKTALAMTKRYALKQKRFILSDS